MYCVNATLLFTGKLHCLKIYFDRSLHFGSSDPTCVHKFRPSLFMVFEILGFKLKKNNDKKNWRNGLFAISPTLMV